MAVMYIDPQRSPLKSTETATTITKASLKDNTAYLFLAQYFPTHYSIHEDVSISLERAPGTTPSCHHSHERRCLCIRLRPANCPLQTFWAPRKRFQQIPLPPQLASFKHILPSGSGQYASTMPTFGRYVLYDRYHAKR